ncbi:MAG: excisionase family DNA-binding protein [Phycisphaerales bacterium]|nr:excisionase family DNA-binding protein [Phycisphaerales bacterium]
MGPAISASAETPANGSGKQVFTTGEAARLCNLSQQTIIRCFDSGRLRGYRVPGSRTRRIPRGELIRFMRSHHMPLDALGESETTVLLVENEIETVQQIRRVAEAVGGYSLHVASNAYEAGVLTAKLEPQVLIVNTRLPDLDVLAACRAVRISNGEPGTTVILLANKFRTEEMQEFEAIGIRHFMRKPLEEVKFGDLLMSAVNV